MWDIRRQHCNRFICGHLHSYSRIQELNYDGQYIPPSLIVGTGGNNIHAADISIIRDKMFKVDKTILKYGFGYLSASDKELRWEWGSASTDGSLNPQAKFWENEDNFVIHRRSNWWIGIIWLSDKLIANSSYIFVIKNFIKWF